MSDDLEKRLDDLYRGARDASQPVRDRWKAARAETPGDSNSDDLEERLDDLYRGARDASQPVRDRWKAGTRRGLPARRTSTPLVWTSLAAAAALAILLPILLRKSPPPTTAPAPAPVVVQPPPPTPLPPREAIKLPATPVAPPKPAPVAPPAPPALPKPAPEPQPVPEPEPEPPPPPAPEPAPRTPEPPRPATRVERALAQIKEIEGAGDLAGRPLKGELKDLVVAEGDRLTATGVVRVTLAADRTVLLAPRAQAVFRPSKERLTLVLEQGELVAELNAPGAELAVVTKTCEIRHLGTTFSVKAEEKRTIVLVEEGRVEVRTPKGAVPARAGQGVVAPENAPPAPVSPGDLRMPAWAKAHRPAERVLYLEDFSVQGDWKGAFENGVARSVNKAGASGSVLQMDPERVLWETPVRGQMEIVYRTDRAGRLKIQTWSREHKVNFSTYANLLKTPGWRTLVVDLQDLRCHDPSKEAGGPPPGTPFMYLYLGFDEDGDRGTIWIDSIRVVSLR
jgi:hypothetical protein